jgi:hypothetical protein
MTQDTDLCQQGMEHTVDASHMVRTMGKQWFSLHLHFLLELNINNPKYVHCEVIFWLILMFGYGYELHISSCSYVRPVTYCFLGTSAPSTMCQFSPIA